MEEQKKIVVRMPNWLGDLVMATPVLKDLRTFFPKASITAMCKRPLSQLLEKDPNIDELFSFSDDKNKFSRREISRNLVGKLKEGQFDIGILLTNSFSSAWRFWRGNVKRRIGYAAHFRFFLLSDRVSFFENKAHQVTQYKKLLQPLGIAISTTMPRIYLEKKEILESKELLFQRGYVPGAKLIGINPGAAYGSAKCWPYERFRKLAEELLHKTDAFIVFFGDLQTADLIKKIVRALPKRVLDLAGVTSLRELASLISDCSVLVSNDSGPMHIGAALNIPLVALFGSTDSEVTGPYQKPLYVIDKKVPCAPCLKRVCPIDFACMKKISVNEVVERVLEFV